MPTPEATALYLLAFVQLRHARPDKAATLLKALDLMEPGQPRTLLALALAQVRSGGAAAGLHTLERLRHLGHASAAYHLLRSQALGALRRHPEASMALRAFLESRTPQQPTSV